MDTKLTTNLLPLSFQMKPSHLDDASKSTSGMIHYRLTSGGVKRTRTNLVLVASLFVCSSVVLFVVLSFAFHLAGVQTELNKLREELDRIEASINAVPENENGIDRQTVNNRTSRNRKRNWARPQNRTALVRPSFAEGQGTSVELELNEGGVGRRVRRSDSQEKMTKRNLKPKKTKEGKKDTKSFSAKAVHFHARNSSERTITTKRDSPVLDFWEPAKWSRPDGKSFYHIRNGAVTILEEGTYFIYVQLVFHDLSGRWAFSVNINDRQELKCINSEHISSAPSLHPTNHGVYQHCFSSRLFYILKLEQVTVRCLYEQRHILVSPDFTFWGIIKMS